MNLKIEPHFLGEKDAARYLGMSQRTLQDYRLNGCKKRGKRGPKYFQPPGIRGVRYRISDLEAWANEHTPGGASAA